MDRRPIKSRETSWAKLFAKFLAQKNISPNTISILSIVMSLISFFAYYLARSGSSSLLLFLGAFFMQMRLLCNLFDGMVAVEYNKVSVLGDIYNDAPDRISDTIIILGVAFYCDSLHIGYLASIFAILTAYIRLLGSTIGTDTFFDGPMSKSHRMFTLTVGTILQIIFNIFDINFNILFWSLVVVSLGGVITCVNRLNKIVEQKKERG